MVHKPKRTNSPRRTTPARARAAAPSTTPSSTFTRYRTSFRSLLQRKTILLLFYDLLFWALLFAGLIAYQKITVAVIDPIEALDLQQDLAQLGLQQDLFQRVAGVLILATVLFGLWILCAWVFSRAMIWRIVLADTVREQTGIAYWGKWFAFSVLWNISLGIAALVLFVIVKQFIPYESFLYPGNALWLILTTLGTAILCTYFTEIAHYRFALSGKVFGTIRQSIREGIKNFRTLAGPIGLVLLTFIALSAVSYLLRLLPTQIYNPLATVLLLAFFAWMRYYVVQELAQNRV